MIVPLSLTQIPHYDSTVISYPDPTSRPVSTTLQSAPLPPTLKSNAPSSLPPSLQASFQATLPPPSKSKPLPPTLQAMGAPQPPSFLSNTAPLPPPFSSTTTPLHPPFPSSSPPIPPSFPSNIAPPPLPTEVQHLVSSTPHLVPGKVVRPIVETPAPLRASTDSAPLPLEPLSSYLT